MSVGYAWEKFLLAVHGMAVSPASIQERLGDAFAFHIMHVEDDDLPGDLSDLGAQLREYREAWERQPGEGGIAKWASSLSTDEAGEVASWIVRAFDRLSVATIETG